mmetsp:Transcript_31131/g.60090  ORF Transcript_31131/g.60090 Transcript_31131/m.60090 type:complete len:227 (+) Transcript_31131:1405-2085(+)
MSLVSLLMKGEAHGGGLCICCAHGERATSPGSTLEGGRNTSTVVLASSAIWPCTTLVSRSVISGTSSSRTVQEMRVPTPNWLCTLKVPCMLSPSSWHRLSPSPAPVAVALSDCQKGSKMWCRSSGATPLPVSVTLSSSTAAPPAASAPLATSTITCPRAVYLMLLATRLPSIWRSLAWLPCRVQGKSLSRHTSERPSPFSRALGDRISIIFISSLITSKGMEGKLP